MYDGKCIWKYEFTSNFCILQRKKCSRSFVLLFLSFQRESKISLTDEELIYFLEELLIVAA